MQDYDQSEEIIDECLRALSSTKDLTDMIQIQQNLDQIKEVYSDIAAWLQEEDENMYNKLFTC